jgi:hypothetical protein
MISRFIIGWLSLPKPALFALSHSLFAGGLPLLVVWLAC